MQFCTKTNRNRTLRGKRNSLPPKLYNDRVIGLAANLHKNHEAVQPVGVAKQDPILLHEAESWLPMLVFLMVTQKTNTTKSTIKAYSTSPWPSSSTNSLFKSSTYLTPFLLKVGTRRVVVSFPCPTRADIMTAQPSSTNYATAEFQWISTFMNALWIFRKAHWHNWHAFLLKMSQM